MTSTTLTTGKVRFSFVNLFEGKVNEQSGKKEYSMCILIPKTDTATINAIKSAVEEAKKLKPEAVFGKKANGERFEYPNLKICLRDGDTERPDREEFSGHYFLNCKTRIQPKVVDANRCEILDPEQVYSGCYGRVNITLYAYITQDKSNRGVSAQLNCVQFLSDGERFTGSGVSVEDAFGGPVEAGSREIPY